MLKNPVFKFFSSLKLAVFSILSLAAVLAYGTITESLFGMRGAHVLVYGTWWFAGVLIMLGTNVLCAALSRFPWKPHQTGFVVTHTGILTLLVGSALTQKLGVDGNLAVEEGNQAHEVILNDLKLVVWDEQERRHELDFPESARAEQGKWLELALGDGDSLVVDLYYPRAVQEKNVVASPLPGIGSPAIGVELFNSRFNLEEWLLVSHPKKGAERDLGPATLSFRKLWSEKEEREFFSPAPTVKERPTKIGKIAVVYRGREYQSVIDTHLKKWTPLSGTPLQVIVDRYLPYAIVDKGELTSKGQEPTNPAVQIRIKDPAGIEEKYTVFAFFPEFTTLHRAHQGGKKGNGLGITLRMIAASQMKEEMSIVGTGRGKLELAQSADDKRILYRSQGAAGVEKAKGEARLGEAIATGWMDLKFKVREWFPHAIEETKPRYIEYIAGGDSQFLPALRISPRSARSTSSLTGRWLFEGDAEIFSVGGRKLTVQLTKSNLALPFRVTLNKFTVGKDPGTEKAATYESEVTVKDPLTGRDQSAKISMNEPLEYAGFTLYQASYQLREGQPPISVFSVNRDPGRWVKYLGSILICLGACLMFYMNPHYWSIVFGRRPIPRRTP